MRRAKTTSEEVELDLGRYELRRKGRRVNLEKKPMDLLIYLVGRRDQLVSREDIVAKLWRSGLFIDSERNINNLMRKIRAALGDDAAEPHFVETVVGKGYRFVGPLRLLDSRFADAGSAPYAAPAQALIAEGSRPHRASLAVLPLLFLGDANDQGLCVGFADALIAKLGNVPGLDVLPTSAVINIPDAVAPSDAAARLAVRFVVHGAVQSSKGQLRLSLELFDANAQRAVFTKRCDLSLENLFDLEDEVARQIAGALNRPLRVAPPSRERHSRDPLAYSEFMLGYRLSSSGDAKLLEQAAEHLIHAVTRDATFSLAHATLSFVYATRHFEYDPSRVWLEKAEFHCRRALELDSGLPEGHVANAFLLWGPSKNFQHLEAIAELRHALRLRKNLPHAYNRLGTILAHIGLLDHARAMYERARPFDAKKAVSHSIVQVHVWSGHYDLAREEIEKWRSETPGNKYPLYFAPQLAILGGDWKDAAVLLDQAGQALPDDPMIISLQGVYHALTGKAEMALECMARACAIPKSFGHAHHSYYQIACILALLDRTTAAFEWLERSVDAGFACWPFFLRDPCLQKLRPLPQFEGLVSALQARFPDDLGLL